MIRIEMLPAEYGDCLLVEYGSGTAVHRLLVDGGTGATYQGPLRERLKAIARPCPLDLLVVTHIDEDHILGVLSLLQEDPKAIAPAEVWFNGYRHLTDTLGPTQGDLLTGVIEALKLPWNAAFKGGAVCLGDDGALPCIQLKGGARVVLLSPGRKQLTDLEPVWKEAITEAKLRSEKEPTASRDAPSDELGKRKALKRVDPSDVPRLARDRAKVDTSPSNGSSVAFILEYEGSKILLAGDAHPGVLAQRLYQYGGGAPVPLDAVKLPHHASRHNVTSELLDAVVCSRFLVSTSGDRFGHPDPEAIARIALRAGSKKVYFNYRTDYTTLWASSALRERYQLSVAYGEDGRSLVEVGDVRTRRKAGGDRPATGAKRPMRPRVKHEKSFAARGPADDRLGGDHESEQVRLTRGTVDTVLYKAGVRHVDMLGGALGASPGERIGVDVKKMVRVPSPSAPVRKPDAGDYRASGAKAAERRAERFVHARVFANQGNRAEEIVNAPLRGNTEHEVQVWIGPPAPVGLQPAQSFDESALPPSSSGQVLKIVFVEAHLAPEPQQQLLLLPTSGESACCRFRVHTGREAGAFNARILVLYGNRILQTLRLSGGIQRPNRKAEPLAFIVEAVIRANLDAVAEQLPFDASFVEAGTGENRTVMAIANGEAAHVSTKGIDQQLGRIRYLLEKISDEPERYGPPDDPDTEEILGELAALGAGLYRTLRDVKGMDRLIDPLATRVQIVSMNPEDVLPLEFCYTRNEPDLDAKICPNWKQALDDAACSVRCPSPESATVCMLGFLGMRVAVERHRYTPDDEARLQRFGAAFTVDRGPEANTRKPLNPLRSLLRGVASVAPGPNPAKFNAALKQVDQAVTVSRSANDWAQWTRQVAALGPGMLLLIAHTEEKKSRDLLVIGNGEELAIGAIDVAHVRVDKPDGASPPLVVLLGCRTGTQDVPFSNYASQFRRKGAAVVLGTVANVRGRYTAQTALRIVEEIKQHSGDSFGVVLTKARRKLLREGNPLGLCLTAFGDADWRL